MYKCLKCKEKKKNNHYPLIGVEIKNTMNKKFSNSIFSPVCYSCLLIEYDRIKNEEIKRSLKLFSKKDKKLIIFDDDIYS